MPGQNIDWVEVPDTYTGNVDNIGVNPYSLSATSPNVTQSQGNQANPLGGLAAALQQYGGGLTVDTGMPGGTLGTPNANNIGADINLPVPGYTDPLG